MIHPWQAPSSGPIRTNPWPGFQAGRANGVTIVPAAHLPPEAPNWIWVNHLACGKLTLLCGGPGTGKTTIAMAVAATVSVGSVAGRHWPDGSSAPAGDVLIWSGEDGIEDTLIPRLIAAHANLGRVHFIRETTSGGRVRAFDPSIDIPQLAAELARYPSIKLLVIDSIVQAVAGNANSNQSVRQAMDPLLDLAVAHEFAVLGITHLTKGSKNKAPLERITGSLAFPAVARFVWMTGKVMSAESGKSSNVFVNAKASIGKAGGGYEYTIESTTIPSSTSPTGFIDSSSVVWGPVLKGSAEEILDAANNTGGIHDASAVDRATTFLTRVLAQGPLPYQQVCALAEAQGISAAAIKRARLSGRPAIHSEKIRGAGSGSGFLWSLLNASTGSAIDQPNPGYSAPPIWSPAPMAMAIAASMHPPVSFPMGNSMPSVPDFAHYGPSPFAAASPAMPVEVPIQRPNGFPLISPDVIGRGAYSGSLHTSNCMHEAAQARLAVPDSWAAPVGQAPRGTQMSFGPVEPLEPLAPVEPVEPVEPVAPGAPLGNLNQPFRRAEQSALVPDPGAIDWAHRACVQALNARQTAPEFDFGDFIDSLHEIAATVVDGLDFDLDDEDAEDALRDKVYQALEHRQWWKECQKLWS